MLEQDRQIDEGEINKRTDMNNHKLLVSSKKTSS